MREQDKSIDAKKKRLWGAVVGVCELLNATIKAAEIFKQIIEKEVCTMKR